MHKKTLLPLIPFSLILAISLLLPGNLPMAATPARADDDPPAKRSESKTKKSDSRKKDDKQSKSQRKKRKGEFPKGDHEKKFREGLGETFSTKYTPHFVVFYNADEKLVRDFIHRLEATFKSVYMLCERTGVKLKKPKEKLVVIYCKDFSDYNDACVLLTGQSVPPGAAGLYYRFPFNFSLFFDFKTSPQMLQYVQQAEQLQREAREAQDRNEKRAKSREARWWHNRITTEQQKTNREVVQHELAHQCLFNFGFHTLEARNPIWLSEGMATQFETPPGKSGAGLGAINQARLGTLRDMIDKQPPDLKTFILRLEASRSIEVEEYAISWGLVNYLLKKHKREFPDFVKAVADRSMEDSLTPGGDLELFEKHFGKIDERFQQSWERFIKSMPYRAPQ